MRTGLGIHRRFRKVYAYYNLVLFTVRKKIFGFDVANQFIQRVDKHSLQLILKKNGATIGKECDIETGLTFHNCINYSNLMIGDNCHIGKNCFFDLRDRVNIGNNVVISMQCCFITHIDLSQSPLRVIYPAKQLPIYIETGCYIGAGARILMGVTIHKQSFIAAHTLVSQSIDQNNLVGGVPAQFIKKLNYNQ